MSKTIRLFLAFEAAAFLMASGPGWTRLAGLAAQGFALLGTLVGAFTIAIGVGPRTVPDVIYHITILIVLAWGLVVTARARLDAGARGD